MLNAVKQLITLNDTRLSMTEAKKKCHWCGGETKWNYVHNSDVPDGRLRMHDIVTVFFLSCLDCSETLKTLSTDEVLKILKEGK